MKRQHTIIVSMVLIIGVGSFSLGWFSAMSGNKQALFSGGSTTESLFVPDTGINASISLSAPAIRIRDMDEIWDILLKSYYDANKLDLPKLSYGAVKGFVSAINDPYTVFMTPEESRDFESGLEGQLDGIGAELEVKQGKLVVVTPLKNSPAERAGILAGDIIVKINQELAEDMTLYEAISKIRGQKGTRVTLTLIREERAQPFDITITRDTITINSVVVEKLEGDIFHVAIHQFNDHMKNEFNNAVQRILLERANGLILDLRGNGGGYLETSVDIVSEFVTGVKPVAVIKKRNEADTSVKTTGNARLPDIPMIILVDKGSASASEIVAGAIQDYKRGLVIGETTFGKGSVQEINSLQDGSSIRLTIAKWFTPLDRSIDEVGIAPDVEIKLTDEDRQNKRDPQLNEALKRLRRR